MKTLLLLLTVACITASGCSKSQPGAGPNDGTPVPAALPETSPPMAAPAPAAENSLDLQAINQALKAYARDKKRVPPNLDELVTAGYLLKAPQPPFGKRFAIDPKKIEVRIEGYRVGF